MKNYNFDIIAKNLLLKQYCQSCNHVKKHPFYKNHVNDYTSCESILRARKEFNIQDIESKEWKNFVKNGLALPKELTCQYWE